MFIYTSYPFCQCESFYLQMVEFITCISSFRFESFQYCIHLLYHIRLATTAMDRDVFLLVT